jgi:RNA polymerase sigma-70 factor (ECF subfamily)
MTGIDCPKYLLSDADCVLRIRRGELEVWRVLYERYYPIVIGYINAKISQYADVQDIVSQVFIDAIDDIDKLKDVQSFQKWLYTIVNHKIINYYRKQKADKIVLVDDLPGESADEKYEKMDRQIQEKLFNSTNISVKNIIRQLSWQEQLILQLNTYYGFSYAEIAQQIGKTEHAVEKMAERAKKKFRRLYLKYYRLSSSAENRTT